MTTALAIAREFPTEQVDLLKRTICKGASDDELSMFVQTAQRLGLDPFARQVFAVKRWDNQERREVMSIQVSIDGFRLVAERTGKYAGQLGPFWSADGKEWVEAWLAKEPPAAAKVGVMRHDFKEPVWSVATWDQYKQTKRDGGLTGMWAKMGPLMLAKCAESLALRRAFPNELSGAYTDAEMSQATHTEYQAPDLEERLRASLRKPAQHAAAPTSSEAPAPSTEPGPSTPIAGTAASSAPASNTDIPDPPDPETPVPAADTGEAATADQKDAIKLHIRKKGWKRGFVRLWFKELFGDVMNQADDPLERLTKVQADSAFTLLLAHGMPSYRKIRQEEADKGLVLRDENELQF